MSLITTAANAALKAEADKVVAAQRAKLQAAFTDSTGKVLIDVSKLTTAHTDVDAGLLVVTDGTVFLAVTRDGFRLVTPDGEGGFTGGAEFDGLVGLALALAGKPQA